ncbi:SH2D3 protein, partial [Amia calva]|nr:SH2D3 protein [Amia calva]
FKWFGSLSNLSFRRSSNTTDSKPFHKHHGSFCEESSYEKSIDDMDACPRSSTYARSSDMYSHMGTMPRKSIKGDKQSRSSKKGKGKGELSRRQSQRQPADFVPESPLMNALSSGGVTNLDKLSDKTLSERPQPPQVVDAPATAEAQVPANEVKASQSLNGQGAPVLPERNKSMKKQDETSPPVLTAQPQTLSPTSQLPVSSANPAGHSTQFNSEETDIETDSSLSDLSQVEAEDVRRVTRAAEGHSMYEEMKNILEDSHLDAMESRGEYVKFSKEKYLLDSPPEKLRRELEEELKLSSSDLRSHGWYHGHIPREVSESVVVRNGDFLIRDSLTSVGDYVLTSRWNHEVLHFKISKVLVKSSDSFSRVQYLLERESFDSVPALVRFYVGNRCPISQQSGAHIYCPVNRTLPLRYLEASFAPANGKHSIVHSPSNQRGAYIKRRSVTMTDGLTTEKIIPHSTSTVHHKDVIRNCALSMDQIQEFRCPMSPVNEGPLSPAYSSITRHKSPAVGRVADMVPTSPVMRRSSEPQLCPSSNNNVPCPDPSPSAHSTPAHGYCQPAAGDPEGAGGNYCELRPNPTPVPLPAKSYVERLRVEETGRVLDSGLYPPGREELGEESFTTPLVETTSTFKPNGYQSLLVPAENKPLEMSVLKRVKELLAEVDAKTAAKHITRADCTVARILGVTKEMQRMMGVSSGLELLTLPHGHQLRLDLLERFNTMSIMMAVDLLGCTGSTEERASLLHKTIQLAAELKSNLGNMFGFAAVMRALELPQISRLEQTWMTLRQRHTEGAILYEKKLKPFMKSMNDGKESCPLSNTSFPHVVPLLSLLEKGVAIGDGAEPWESMDAGVDVVMSHLEAARTIAHHGGIYRTNAETKLQGFQERPEVLEIFRTEFQMRLLWGSRGAEGSQTERYEKFDKVLTALSNKLEPPIRHSEL